MTRHIFHSPSVNEINLFLFCSVFFCVVRLNLCFPLRYHWINSQLFFCRPSEFNVRATNSGTVFLNCSISEFNHDYFCSSHAPSLISITVLLSLLLSYHHSIMLSVNSITALLVLYMQSQWIQSQFSLALSSGLLPLIHCSVHEFNHHTSCAFQFNLTYRLLSQLGQVYH